MGAPVSNLLLCLLTGPSLSLLALSISVVVFGVNNDIYNVRSAKEKNNESVFFRRKLIIQMPSRRCNVGEGASVPTGCCETISSIPKPYHASTHPEKGPGKIGVAYVFSAKTMVDQEYRQ